MKIFWNSWSLVTFIKNCEVIELGFFYTLNEKSEK